MDERLREQDSGCPTQTVQREQGYSWGWYVWRAVVNLGKAEARLSAREGKRPRSGVVIHCYFIILGTRANRIELHKLLGS